MNLKAWLSAFRLRTLPLSLASILMGSFLAASVGAFRWEVLGLACLTTVLLQILSNLANDYGDSVHGADHADRQGPSRAVQSGAISHANMKKAIALFVVLSLLAGLGLLWLSFHENITLFLSFLGLGVLAIVAAITYTAGGKPYGYAGLGDISVLIFFGYVGVLGTFFLHSLRLDALMVLPATTSGCFAVAVLNINNIRDIESDSTAGKKSIPVRIGLHNAVFYHLFLLGIGFLSSLVYVLLTFEHWAQYLFLLATPLLFINAKGIYAARTQYSPAHVDKYLKQMALTSLFFTLLLGVGQLIPIL